VVHIVTNGQLLVAWGPRARSIMFGSIIHDYQPHYCGIAWMPQPQVDLDAIRKQDQQVAEESDKSGSKL